MKRMIIAVLILIVTNLVFAVPDRIDINFQLQTDAEGKLRGRGYPDSNYVWEGDILVWEREITDEDGNKRIVKTYKKPIEIIANFKANSRIFGIEGNIEKIAVKKFGGALKGFVWLDNVSGGGEVILPFTAPHIFIARGDRLNPDLTEISIDTNEDNYYEVIEGRTRVVVKSFSGIGGAAGAPPTLIAHYKFNENTAGDNAELVTNGNFANWTSDNPNNWTVNGETSPSSHTIDGVDTTAETFTISGEGDLSTWFKDGNIFEVTGSTGNNGQWKVLSTIWSDPNFIITVTGDITNATADGTITPHPDPDVSQVGTGEGHGGAGTGMCNIYTSDGTAIEITRTINTIIGRKYRFSINVDTVTAGALLVYDNLTQWVDVFHTSTGIKTFTFVALETSFVLGIRRGIAAHCDITFDDVSLKLLAVEDSSGNDHDGLAQQDTSAISVAGKINTAFDFNGSSDYIEIPDHDDFTPALTPFSVSIWVKADDATNFPIVSKGVEGTDGEWRFYTDGSDKLFAHFYDENINKYIGRTYNAAALTQNIWLHLVMTYNGGVLSAGVKLYLNGVQVDDTDSLSATFVAVENLNHAVWIGRYSTTYANGVIENVTFFSVELSLDEVKRLYNNGHGTEILAEVDSVISPRRSNTSPLGLRARYEFP